MQLDGRNEEIYKGLVAHIVSDIAANPQSKSFRSPMKAPMKLAGMGKLTVPTVVWDALVTDEALSAWEVSIEDADGRKPEFVMIRL
jgi:hypothetical protein